MSSKFDPNLIKMLKQIRYQSAGFFFVNFIIPIIAFKEFNADGFEMGILFSLQIIGTTISSPISGFFSNKHETRSKVILVGSIGRALSYIVVYIAIVELNYEIMVIGTFLLGFSAGFFWAPLNSTISDATPYDNRSEAFGINQQQAGIGVMIGSTFGFTFLGFASSNDLSLNYMYFPLVVYALANLLGGYLMFNSLPKINLIEGNEELVEDNNVVENSSFNIYIGFGLILLILFFENVIGSLVAPFLQVFLISEISESEVAIAFAYVPGAIISLMIAPSIGKLVDKVNLRLWLFSTSLIAALTTWLLINSTAIWQFSLLFIIDSSIVASAGLVLTKLVSNVSKNKRGSIFGLQGFATNFGAIIGPLLGGIIWENYGIRGPFLFSIGVEIIIAFVYLGFMRIILCEGDEVMMKAQIVAEINTPDGTVTS